MPHMRNPGAGGSGALEVSIADSIDTPEHNPNTAECQVFAPVPHVGSGFSVIVLSPDWRAIRTKYGWGLQPRAGQRRGRPRWSWVRPYRSRAALVRAARAFCRPRPGALAALAPAGGGAA